MDSMSLWEIDREIRACIEMEDGDFLNTETGEIISFERLNALQMEQNRKIENIACAIKNYSAAAAALKAEKEELEKREKRALKKVEGLKSWLTVALHGEKFTTSRCAVSFRRSEAVEITEESSLPKEMLIEKITYSPNKTAIKEAIKAGQEIPGAQLVERLNASIK